MSNSALIIIDLQNDFMNMIGESLIKDITKAVKLARNIKMPIYWIYSIYGKTASLEQENIIEDTYSGEEKICVSGTLGIKFIPEIDCLIKSNDIILEKKWFSCFKENDLHTRLKKSKITNLYFAGVATNTSIYASIFKAKELEYKSSLIKDCTFAENVEKYNDGLDLISQYGSIINLESFEIEIYTYGSGTRIYYEILKESINFETLKKEINFNIMTSHGSPVPRLIAIQGQIIEGKSPLYRHPADEQPFLTEFSPSTKIIRDYLSELLNQELNHVLIQYYRDGEDNIGEHSDKTLDIKRGSNIVNFSLGATRIMTLKKKDCLVKENIILSDHSLLVLNLDTNREWLHSIKQDLRPKKIKDSDELICEGGRISFTFRTIATFIDKEGKITGQGEPKIIGIDDKLEMLKAFSKENHENNFDWEKNYGSGFNALNFKFIDGESINSNA